MLPYHYHSLCRPLGRWAGISGAYEIDGRELYTEEALDAETIDRLELEPANDLARRAVDDEDPHAERLANLRASLAAAGRAVGGLE